MRKFVIFAALTLASTGSAVAGGGMGDSAAVLRQNNAICEMQRRGEGPLYPNLCLPEYPLTPVAPERRRRR